jgi:hypothetical protein
MVNDWAVQGAANTATAQALKESEVDEAAADMFLNWVYRKIPTPPAPSPTIEPFKNTDWKNVSGCATPGTPQPTHRPGDARYNYMNTVVFPTLATYAPTPTPTATP